MNFDKSLNEAIYHLPPEQVGTRDKPRQGLPKPASDVYTSLAKIHSQLESLDISSLSGSDARALEDAKIMLNYVIGGKKKAASAMPKTAQAEWRPPFGDDD